jgi:hypothetical protein
MDLSKLTPADASVTLRGLERRYRGLFAGLGEDESPDDVARRQVAGWSAIDHVVAAARAIGAADRALAATLSGSGAGSGDGPTLSPEDVGAAPRPHPGSPTGPVHERQAELGFDAASTVPAPTTGTAPPASATRPAGRSRRSTSSGPPWTPA